MDRSSFSRRGKRLIAIVVFSGAFIVGAAASGSAWAAGTDTYLELDGASGESQDAKNTGKIGLVSWSWGD